MNHTQLRLYFNRAIQRTVFIASVLLINLLTAFAGFDDSYISTQNGEGKFILSSIGKSAPICFSSQDYPGVQRVARQLQTDIEKVTNVAPMISLDTVPSSPDVVIIGTIGKNPIIQKFIDDKKLDVQRIAGKWESFLIQVIEKPFPNINRALVIVGSDKRGTIFGVYDLSEQIGVSPWYWWADVPIEHKDNIFVQPGIYIEGPPSVKYRGIFLNDEYPDLTKWITEKFGNVPVRENPPTHPGIANYNHEFYVKLFELILRLKGNYLWPAMWNNAFNEDDPENPKLADEYGIVMGTSHQEPMLRAQKEWDRRYSRTIGSWNYAKYPDSLERFWREGIRRNKQYESIITIGLRGADDTPMAPGGPEANMKLLDSIVQVQRNIIAQEMKTDVTTVPQLWCLYKEVLDFYNAGMRVPDDVTLLWAEDNWGNVRRLPTADECKRSGGAGIYYHFDYHGGPRSYQWINTNPISKIWDQMSLAKQYGADRIWIVNVGHFKGYEFPLEYFMKLAWNTDKYTNNNILDYTVRWSQREFGATYANDIADIISKYTKYNGRRKPELLSTTTYSLTHYQEAENVVSDYKTIAEKAEKIYSALPENKRDAFYELVLFPTKACALANELYFTAGKNALYAQQGRASANDMADKTQSLFESDTSLMGFFNRDFAHGKWNHFMDQSHLGYMNWQDPPTNSLRAVKLTKQLVPNIASMGVAVEGSEDIWPGAGGKAVLPKFDVFDQQHHYIDIFNKGKNQFEFSVTSKDRWIIVSEHKGIIDKEKRIWVSIDWQEVSKENIKGTITIAGTNTTVSIQVEAFKPKKAMIDSLQGFVEGEGCISIEAEHYTKKIDSGARKWIPIQGYGHTLSALRATAPAYDSSAIPGKDSPCLEYKIYVFTKGTVDVNTIFSPTLNFMPGRALRYAIAFDSDTPQVVTLVPQTFNAQHGNMDWEKVVADNMRQSHSMHKLPKPGYHTVKIWMVDPGVVLEKLVVDLGGVKPSYLGPPESFHRIIH